jgi:hypothetical protein
MARYVSATEFRLRFSEMAEDLRKSGEIVVMKRFKPLFKVVPVQDAPSAFLDRAAELKDSRRPELQEISQIVHKLRRAF